MIRYAFPYHHGVCPGSTLGSDRSATPSPPCPLPPSSLAHRLPRFHRLSLSYLRKTIASKSRRFPPSTRSFSFKLPPPSFHLPDRPSTTGPRHLRTNRNLSRPHSPDAACSLSYFPLFSSSLGQRRSTRSQPHAAILPEFYRDNSVFKKPPPEDGIGISMIYRRESQLRCPFFFSLCAPSSLVRLGTCDRGTAVHGVSFLSYHFSLRFPNVFSPIHLPCYQDDRPTPAAAIYAIVYHYRVLPLPR
ncbi:hypothetical protein BJV74DRAFT_210552 [Russula compacta]|nr:hypothetical protein BJV74DRAFT_210552 [Russula compacta]